MSILSTLGSGLYDMATMNPLTLGIGAYQRYQRGPSFGEFVTNTPTQYTPMEQRIMQMGGGQQSGLTRMQNDALQQMQNQGFFSSMYGGLRNLRDEGMNTLTGIPGQIGGSMVRGGMNMMGMPQGEQLQQMSNQQQGFDPSLTRYRGLEQLAQGLESGQGWGNTMGSLGQIGGSYFGPNAAALGGIYGSSLGQTASMFTNPSGVFGQSNPYKQNFQREYGMAQSTPRYWDQRNRNINPGMNMNPMQRGY